MFRGIEMDVEPLDKIKQSSKNSSFQLEFYDGQNDTAQTLYKITREHIGVYPVSVVLDIRRLLSKLTHHYPIL